MSKLMISAFHLLACVFVMTSSMANAASYNIIEGKYHCVEYSQNKAISDITSHLTVSKTDKGLYKFHWDYVDGTHFEGMSSPKKRPSSIFILEYLDKTKTHLPDKQSGFETFEIQNKGKLLIGRFSTLDHKDMGEEKCVKVESK